MNSAGPDIDFEDKTIRWNAFFALGMGAGTQCGGGIHAYSHFGGR